MDLVHDFQPEFDHNLDEHCNEMRVAVIVPKQWDISLGETQLILCPSLFGYGTIEGGKGKEWPGAKERKCSNIGDRVSRYMLTLGSALLHEYTHATELVQSPLKALITDRVYSFYKTRNLEDKNSAKSNADSYSLFAADLIWTLLCDRDFAPPVEDNSLRLQATGAPGQRPRRDVQIDSLLQKRTAFSQPYRYPIPKTNVDNTYTVDQMDQFLEGHVDALQLCRVVIKQSTKNPTGFDKIFREHFAPKDRELVISKFLLRLEQDRSAEVRC
jgi:hypothetical protein